MAHYFLWIFSLDKPIIECILSEQEEKEKMMDYNSPVPANQNVRCVSYALSVIQDCLAAIKCSTQSELNKQTFRDRIELFSKDLPEANDPIWQTDMFKIYFPKFLELTNR